jgi:hypothetical protein
MFATKPLNCSSSDPLEYASRCSSFMLDFSRRDFPDPYPWCWQAQYGSSE